MTRGEELVLTVEQFAAEGKSLARVEGMVIFVPGGVPGDTVRIRVRKVKRNYANGELLEVLTPSPRRVTPQCSYFGTCGGCRWQQVEYAAQLEFKRQHVIDCLERIGGFRGVEVRPVLGAEAPYFYRNKMEFSFGERWLARQELDALDQEGRAPLNRFALGLHVPLRFDRVLDIHECWLQSSTSQTIVNTVREFCLERQLTVYSTVSHTGYLRNLVIREGRRTGEMMVNLVTSDDLPDVMQAFTRHLLSAIPGITTITNNMTQRRALVAIGETERIYHGPGYITERIGTKVFRVSANSFFQTNTEQTERLFGTVRTFARLTSGDVVFDFYSGTGTIALCLADEVAEVVGIESVGPAVDDARRNAALNGVTNCTFVLGDLKEMLVKDTRWLENRSLPSVIVLDPPRAGVHEKVLEQIRQLRPARVVYVSCNPATQARDLQILCARDAYTVTDAQPVDMFPLTSHIENVVALSRGT